MNRKILVSSGILLLSLLGELLLWNKILIFSSILILLAYIKYKMYPIKKELLWYCSICFGGAIVEIILVNIGHGWSYTNPQYLGIPVWIPLFWGLVGTTIIVLYEGITNRQDPTLLDHVQRGRVKSRAQKISEARRVDLSAQAGMPR